MKMRNARKALSPIAAAGIIAASLIAACIAPGAAAQEERSSANVSFPYQAYVTTDKLFIRAGGGDAYYPFAQLNSGDIVTVIGERFNWARVQTAGRAFADCFGYISAENTRLGADGRTLTTLAKVAVLAPNFYRDMSPEASWRPIGTILPDHTLNVQEVVETQSGDYYKVDLPGSCEGWVSMRFLRAATQDEVLAWDRGAAQEQKPADANRNEAATAAEAAAPQGNTTTTTPDDAATPAAPTTPLGPPATLAQEQPAQGQPEETQGGDIVNADLQHPAAATSGESLANALAGDTEEGAVDAASSEQPSEAEQPQIALIDELEAAYEALKAVPIQDAEIDALRNRYQTAVESGELDRKAGAIATARVQMLDARLELQSRLAELDAVRNRAQLSEQTAEAARMQLEMAATYAAVGVVKASTIYDGTRLPRMLRVADPGTGRTLAYIKPADDRFDFTAMVGQMIGVVGTKTYDASLRLNVIQPTRVDLLTRAE